MKLRTMLLVEGKTATGFAVPEEMVESLGAGKRPAVNVTINGYTYRSHIAPMGGRFLVPVSAEVRQGAGVKGGDEIEVEITLDTEPREVEVPEDLAAALEVAPEAKAFWETMSYSNRRRHILQIEGAKAAETRQRRIEKSVQMFRDGKV